MLLKSVTIIGSGNVATQLAKALFDRGVSIDAVYSKNTEHAKILADLVQAQVINDLTRIPFHSSLYIIAVSDKAIAEVAAQLPEVDGLVVHTAGMVPMNVLNKHKHHGVFYPLQSLTKSAKTYFANVPFLIETYYPEDVYLLGRMGDVIGSPIHEVKSEQRQFYHLAAVFANNFTNHLYHIASTVLEHEKLSFDILKPIILETARKVKEHSPYENQTGPAKRNDTSTMEQHLNLLSKDPQYKLIYEMLSNSIRQTYAADDKKA